MKMFHAIFHATDDSKIDDIRAQLDELDLQNISITEVKCLKKGAGPVEYYRGTQHVENFMIKAELRVAVRDYQIDQIIEALDTHLKNEDCEVYVTSLEAVYRKDKGIAQFQNVSKDYDDRRKNNARDWPHQERRTVRTNLYN